MKRRFRLRRRRIAAAALLPLAATITYPALGAGAESGAQHARIDVSQHSVPFGDALQLAGSFPGSARSPIDVRYRAKGAGAWHTVATDRTGASGRYRVRVKPGGSGYWRAELADVASTTPADPVSAVASEVDRDTGSERVKVRSRTRARVAGRNGTVGDRVVVRGKVSPAGAQRQVVVSVGGQSQRTEAGRGGHFRVAWKAPRTGVFQVEARARSNRRATGSRDKAGRVTVYRPAAASWYGPGLYGNALACGGTLSASTMGVANRSLPCGTKVHLRYGHRSVTVPVIDRGPFSGSREYDLTSATKQKLGFPDVGTVLTTR
jgi:hypothetical protein